MDLQAVAAEEVAGANAIDRLATIFACDTMLACQFNDMRRRATCGDEGIAKLWVAVLEDGIRCFLGDGAHPDGDGVAWRSRRWRLQQEAREWIFEYDDGGPFSFTGLCESLGLSADYIREKLAKRGDMRIPRKSPVRSGTRLIHRNSMGRL